MRRIKRLLSLAMAGALLLCTTLTDAFADTEKSAKADSATAKASDTAEAEKSAKSKKKQKKEATEASKADQQADEKDSGKSDTEQEAAKEDKADESDADKAEAKQEVARADKANGETAENGDSASKSDKAVARKDADDNDTDKQDKDQAQSTSKDAEEKVSLSLSITKSEGITGSGSAYEVDPTLARALTLTWNCKGSCNSFEVEVSGGAFSASTKKTSVQVSLASLSAGKYTATVKAIRNDKTVAKEKLSFQIMAVQMNDAAEKSADTAEVDAPAETTKVMEQPTEEAQQTQVAEAEQENEEAQQALVDDAEQVTGEAQQAQVKDAEQVTEEAQQALVDDAEPVIEEAQQTQVEDAEPVTEEAQQAQVEDAEQVAEEAQQTLVEDAEPVIEEAQQAQVEDAEQMAEEAQLPPVAEAEEAQETEEEQHAQAAEAEQATDAAQQTEVADAEQFIDTMQQTEVAVVEQTTEAAQQTEVADAEQATEAARQTPVEAAASQAAEEGGEPVAQDESPAPEVVDDAPAFNAREGGQADEAQPTRLSLSVTGMQGLSVVDGVYRIDPTQASALALSWQSDGHCDSYAVKVSGGVFSDEIRDSALTLPLTGLADGLYTVTVGALVNGETAVEASLRFQIATPQPTEAEAASLLLTVADPQGLLITDGIYQVDATQVEALTLAWQGEGRFDSYQVSVSGDTYSGETQEATLTLPTAQLAVGQYTATVQATLEGAEVARAQLTFEIIRPTASEELVVSITDPKDLSPTDGVYAIDTGKVDALTLEWQSAVDCDSYRVSVSGDVYSADTTDTSLRLSIKDLADGDYTVTVTALKDGNTVAQAQLTFRIGAGGQGAGDQQQGGQQQGGQQQGGGAKGGSSAKGGNGDGEEDQGFHITPGEALISTHTSGTRDMSFYGSVALTVDSEAEMTQLILGDAPLDIRLSDSGTFRASLDEDNALSLVPTGPAEAWLLNGYALRTLARSGVDSLKLQLNGETIEFSTQPTLTGREYGALCAAGRVSKDFGYAVYADGVNVTVAGQTYRLTPEGELT